MALCQQCPRRNECAEICPAVNKEITGRGKTASLKPKTYLVDFSHIVDTRNALNPFQLDVLNTIRSFTNDIGDRLVERLTVEEAIDTVLNGREKQVIHLFMESYKQEEISKTMNVSQPRVNFLLKRALRKLKNYLEGL